MFVIVPLNQFTIANFPSQTITENVKNGAKISDPNKPTKGAKLTEQLIVPEQNSAKQQLTVAEKCAMPIDSKNGEINVASLEINESDNEEDIHICGKCRKEFTRYDIFILHKKSCRLRPKRNKKTDNEKPKGNTETINIFHKSPSPFIFSSSPAQVNSPTLSDELHPEEQTAYQSINEKCKNKTTENVIQKEIQETSVNNNSEHLLKNPKPVDKDSSDDFAKVSELSESVDNFVNDDICSSGNKEKWKYCSFEGCNYKGRFNKDVVRHYRTHSGAKPWTCELCDKPFARKDKLGRHMSIHSGEKKYSCIYCPYKTYEKSHLNKHIRIHTGETPYPCKVCPYKSKSSSQLAVHMRKHTGETPFGCSFVGCETTFKTSSDLNRHKQIHAAVKPYSCHICGHKVCFKGNLKTHMAKIHNV